MVNGLFGIGRACRLVLTDFMIPAAANDAKVLRAVDSR
jgi:hypothetical protein